MYVSDALPVGRGTEGLRATNATRGTAATSLLNESPKAEAKSSFHAMQGRVGTAYNRRAAHRKSSGYGLGQIGNIGLLGCGYYSLALCVSFGCC